MIISIKIGVTEVFSSFPYAVNYINRFAGL